RPPRRPPPAKPRSPRAGPGMRWPPGWPPSTRAGSRGSWWCRGRRATTRRSPTSSPRRSHARCARAASSACTATRPGPGPRRARGVGSLTRQAARARAATHAGRHLGIATPAASGESPCYTLPVVASALQERGKALYLFPTEALAQDQVSELLELNAAGDLGLRAATFDGDTPGDARRAIRTSGDIVVSNPDMLHQGILPHHTKWAQF